MLSSIPISTGVNRKFWFQIIPKQTPFCWIYALENPQIAILVLIENAKEEV